MDIVVFIACKIYFLCFIEALNWKRIINTLKKVLRQPWSALTLKLSLRDK